MKADGFSNPNIISQKQDHSFQRLISLSTSDIADTCWKSSVGNVFLQFEFYSDGTYESTVIDTNNPSNRPTGQGEWRISSGVVMTKAIREYVGIGDIDWVTLEETEWILFNLNGYTPC